MLVCYLCCWPFDCWVGWFIVFKTSLYVCLSFPTREKKEIKRDSELLQSWILGSAVGLPKQAWLVHLARNKRCHS